MARTIYVALEIKISRKNVFDICEICLADGAQSKRHKQCVWPNVWLLYNSLAHSRNRLNSIERIYDNYINFLTLLFVSCGAFGTNLNIDVAIACMHVCEVWMRIPNEEAECERRSKSEAYERCMSDWRDKIEITFVFVHGELVKCIDN